MKKNTGKLIAAAILILAAAVSAIILLPRMTAPGAGIDRSGDATPAVTLPPPTPRPTETPEPPTYTFNKAIGVFPTDWNPHRCDTAADAELLSYLSAGLYEFELNKSGDGFRLGPCMAAGLPEDITSELIGSYGLTEGETQRAYAIPLRHDLCWEDGMPITAEDFVASAQRLLEPRAANPRADILSEGDLALAGSAEYIDQIKPIRQENALNAFYTMADLSPGKDGVYCTPEGQLVYLALDYPLEYLLYGDTLRFYVETYGEKCFDLRSWESLLARMNEDGLAPLTDESYILFEGLVTGNPLWGDSEEAIPAYFICDTPLPPVSWDSVGIFARGDYELVLVLAQPLDSFDLLYALTDCWLVRTELYDDCAVWEGKNYTNSYGTSLETTISCGPYILKELEPNNLYYLTRNPLYFGLGEEDGRRVYQTTDVVAEYVPDARKRLERFLSGRLDSCLLGEETREAWEGSACSRSIPGDTSYLMVFNPDREGLEREQEAAGANVNKTILTLEDFRRAMSLSLDRAAFCSALSPANRPALALFTPLIIADPFLGVPYRATEQGQAVIAGVWGDSAGLEGYDPAQAKELFDSAWMQALDAGLVNSRSVVEICIGLPSDSEFYEKGFELITEQFDDAVEDTRLEGRLRFTKAENLGSDCYAALRENRVDMLFGVGWAGSPLDPHGLMEAYLSDAYRYDSAAWDTATVRLSVAIHGESYTASVMEWYEIMCGETRSVTGPDGSVLEFSCGEDGNPGTRLDILAALEAAVLCNFDVIPMSEGRTGELWGWQVCCGTDDYIFGLGFGGVKYLTYAFSDREWAEFVSDNGGLLGYE